MFKFDDLNSLSKMLFAMPFIAKSNGFDERVLDEFEKRGWEKLGDDYYLAPIEGLGDNRLAYSNLYKKDEKISDLIFRKGGMNSGWHGDYISLIHYEKEKPKRTGKPPKPSDPKFVFSMGLHCIVDKQGNIVYTASGITRYPHLCGGCLLTDGNDNLINLKTNTIITKYDGSTLQSDKFLFVENHYNKNYPLGVYKVEYETGNYECFEYTR